MKPEELEELVAKLRGPYASDPCLKTRSLDATLGRFRQMLTPSPSPTATAQTDPPRMRILTPAEVAAYEKRKAEAPEAAKPLIPLAPLFPSSEPLSRATQLIHEAYTIPPSLVARPLTFSGIPQAPAVPSAADVIEASPMLRSQIFSVEPAPWARPSDLTPTTILGLKPTRGVTDKLWKLVKKWYPPAKYGYAAYKAAKFIDDHLPPVPDQPPPTREYNPSNDTFTYVYPDGTVTAAPPPDA